MQRTIKFRGKRVDTGEWAYGSLETTWNNKTFIWIPQAPLGLVIEVDPATVGEFTGMVDKAGREIYEGDICQDKYGIGEVRWLQEHCSFVIRTVNPEHRYFSLQSDGQLKSTEIIGNIHDNPELMEGEV